MMTGVPLPRWGQVYVWAVVLAGAAPVIWSLHEVTAGDTTWHWVFLASLTFFSAPFSIRLNSLKASVSASEALVFASALVFGTAAATLTVALDGLLVSLSSRRRRIPLRTAFNVAEPAISVWVSSSLFYALSGAAPLFQRPVALGQVFLPLLALTSVYFVLNTAFMATVVWFENGVPPTGFVRKYAPHLSLSFFASLSLGILLVLNADNIDFATIGVIVPLLVMSYFSSKASLARVEDANNHLAELNTLYLSTVETLAMAIDAKDQITHGHIRRVQFQVVALAQALGVADPREVRAIEAAALLHDLGKLAVPEHILNKPSALTPTEFEQMKAHASIGANILSRIEFPYPVTPIVRHHHEAWDGSGYPDGLSGESIPLGARILAVVDCFDALTSHRPYRRRLPDEDALQILQARRGTIYDPRVVDRFVAIFSTLSRDSADQGEDVMSELAAGTGMTRKATRLDIRERAAVADAGSAAGGSGEPLSIEEIGRSLTRPLEVFGRDVFFTIFQYEQHADDLVAAYVSSAQHAFIVGTRIPLGERVSGWVAANRRTIVNSDPALDLGPVANQATPRLHRLLATPLVSGDTLIGVCTLYSADPRGFSEEHARWLELLAGDVVGRSDATSATVASLANRPRLSRRHSVHPLVIRPFDRGGERSPAAHAAK